MSRFNLGWAIRAFARSNEAVAAVEFGLILPVMFLLFFGMMEASDLMTVKRRIANAANSLSDLVSHDPMITRSQVADSIIGVKRLLEPTNTSGLNIRVTSVLRGPSPGDPVTVHWSIDEDGATPYPAGQVFTKLTNNDMVNNVASLIVVEMDYTYVSELGGRVFTTPFTFDQMARRWPRKSPRVQLCTSSDPATCTS
jgi:Flp pilus assembly protein TadG